MLLATLLFLLLSPCHLLAISCNFETDLCEWGQNASNILQWIRDNGHDEKLPYQGPKYDHTLNGKGKQDGSRVQTRLCTGLKGASEEQSQLGL
ncbi:hypothetical protein scyTo_0022473 [Scyliorhinus torazame]|uniref:MAM domain-containing protein n=1 Tax=Scyliorhinus torazame TaxID=75743 RepID=A0A401Q764_SCYTO|nr:hypothetical protein [Scyliorhinus torazame]